jgi:hypothetical protein
MAMLLWGLVLGLLIILLGLDKRRFLSVFSVFPRLLPEGSVSERTVNNLNKMAEQASQILASVYMSCDDTT